MARLRVVEKSNKARSAQTTKAKPRLRVVPAPESDEQPAVVGADFDASMVIVDRDQLRELRTSEAAETVFAASKGGDALATIRARKGGPDHIHRINPYDIWFEEGHNERDFTTVEMRERVAEYARSIATRGVRVALDLYVKGDRLYANNGETRWRATMHAIIFLNAKIEGLPVLISQGENALDRVIDQWLGNDTLRFDPMATGRLFRRALDMGATPVEIAHRIGKNPTYITERVKLLEMPSWLQSRVGDGSIRPDTAFKAIWKASGEDDLKAKKLLKASVESANDAGASRVMPKHIRRVGGTRTVQTVATMVSDLAAILGRHERATLEDALGNDDAASLFKLAKL